MQSTSLTLVNETVARAKLALAGSLDMEGVILLENEFQSHAAKGKSLIVDLTQVAFLSSLGIRMLLSACKSLKAQGHKVVLVRPQPQVERTLRIMRLHEVMSIADSDDAAERYADTK